MSAHFGAMPAAFRTVAEGLGYRKIRTIAAIATVAGLLAGCIPTAPLIGADPSDPNVPVAGVNYRSGIVPYSSMRPATPAGWKDQNQRATPTPQPEQ